MKRDKDRGQHTQELTIAGLTAALYTGLTLISQTFGLASGAIQFRLSEALMILPAFTWAAVPGLAAGCVLSNLLTGCALWDVVFGSLATLMGAYGTFFLSGSMKKLKPADTEWGIGEWMVLIVSPVLSNMAVIPVILKTVYGAEGGYWYFLFTVGIGEAVCCGVLGILLGRALKRTGIF